MSFFVIQEQYEHIIRHVFAEEWAAAMERLTRIREVRPSLARKIVNVDHPIHGSLISNCIIVGNAAPLVRIIIGSGANPNEYSSVGTHILLRCMEAYSSLRDSNISVFRELLEGGADPDAVGDISSGRPILHWAIINKKAAFLADLLKYGADPEYVSDSGEDAFSVAAKNNCVDAIAILKDWRPTYFDWAIDC